MILTKKTPIYRFKCFLKVYGSHNTLVTSCFRKICNIAYCSKLVKYTLSLDKGILIIMNDILQYLFHSFAITFNSILTSTIRRDVGLQFLINLLSLSFFSIKVTTAFFPHNKLVLRQHIVRNIMRPVEKVGHFLKWANLKWPLCCFLSFPTLPISSKATDLSILQASLDIGDILMLR